MAATLLSDVIIPEVFTPYMIERTAELSRFFTSGLIAPVSEVGNQSEGGGTVNMPFWQDLTGDDQILDDSTDLTVTNIGAEKDVAVWNGRALVYGAKDLVQALAGDDPMAAIADLMAAKWDRQFQKILLAVIQGAMSSLAAESPAVNTLDISGLSGAAAVFDGEAFIDALGTLGDAEQNISAVAVHSATHRLMKKLNLIDYLLDSEGMATIPSYQGKLLLIDDGLPYSGGVATTYLFGQGAIGYAEGSPKVPTETERNALVGGGEEYMVSRRHFVMHPRGIAWTPASGGIPAKTFPSNAELGAAANWTRKYESKNIRIVRFKHKLA
jgi:hypothetical protein